MRCTRKRANPRSIITGFQKVFKHVSVKKNESTELLLDGHCGLRLKNLSYQRDRFLFTDRCCKREI